MKASRKNLDLLSFAVFVSLFAYTSLFPFYYLPPFRIPVLEIQRPYDATTHFFGVDRTPLSSYFTHTLSSDVSTRQDMREGERDGSKNTD